MELDNLGFDQWFRERWQAVEKPGFTVARVTAVDRDRYLVRNEHTEVPAEVTGKLLFNAESGADLPTVGDWVNVQYYDSDTHAIIHDVLTRKTFLRRKSADRQIDYQMIAANVDVAFIVQACDADFNVRRLERYLVTVSEGNIEPVILLTKSDLITSHELEQRIEDIRKDNVESKIISLSNITENGLEQFRKVLERGITYCLIGSSGVGKTTLLNKLIGREAFETNPVREKDGRGRHTTVRRQLIVLDNGAMIIDTPGMRELGMIGTDAGIEESFADVHDLTQHCRFSDCTHTTEPGCAIYTAIENGTIDEHRYRSYLKLKKESAYHQLSYVEKRWKDREFGRMVKAFLKNNKKK